MPAEELTNTKLSRIFTLEFMGSLAVMAFVVGVSYNNLASGQEKTDKRMDKIEDKQTSIETTVQQIKVDTATMRVSQDFFKEELAEQRQGIRRILDILEMHNTASHNGE